jgi:hypothetical protein
MISEKQQGRVTGVCPSRWSIGGRRTADGGQRFI